MTIDGIQLDIHTRIANDAWISPATGKKIAVIHSVKGDIQAQVNTAIGKLGACVVIDPPRGPLAFSNNTVTMDGTVDVWIFENVLLNRGASGTGKTAGQIAAKVIHLFKPGTAQPITITSFEPQETAGRLLVLKAIGQLGRRSLEEPS